MRRRSWDVDRVYFYDTGGELVCLPAEWTDAVPADPFVVAAAPFVVAAAGRVPFRTADLLAAAAVAERARASRDSNGTPGVQKNMP
jgi:hypothetical protein